MKKLLIYVWHKIQDEVNQYWRNKNHNIKLEKLKIFEETRLCIISYITIQSQCPEIFGACMALEPFVDSTQIEEALPLATFQNAIQVILKDYECLSNSNSNSQEESKFISRDETSQTNNEIKLRLSNKIHNQTFGSMQTSQGILSQRSQYQKVVETLKKKSTNNLIRLQGFSVSQHYSNSSIIINDEDEIMLQYQFQLINERVKSKSKVRQENNNIKNKPSQQKLSQRQTGKDKLLQKRNQDLLILTPQPNYSKRQTLK
eukprot:403376813